MQPYNADDHRFMRRALECSLAVKGSTFPNPAVGAVIVNNGRIVGEGATAKWGGPHAEIAAIASAGSRARGSRMFVTLEPCCHFGKTAPCTDAIIASGITGVIVAVRDPNPLIAGKGIARLRRHGIHVITGLLREEARSINEDFFWSITKKRAFITLKIALTLDGRIADESGGSKWITSSVLRRSVHDLRSRSSAIAVGIGTLEADDPKLTVRFGRVHSNPARIIFSSCSDIPRKTFFHRNARKTRSIVVIRKKTRRRIEVDKRTGIEFWYTGESGPADSMRVFSEMAFSENLTSVLVEGGQRIASTLLEAGLVNRLYLFYGNQVLGKGIDGIWFQKGLPVASGIRLKDRRNVVTGDDMYITGIPVLPEGVSGYLQH